ncbi:6-carboxytetrahydropterin synthase [bacterium]|nr:6-carboxytetrahydropterin synthase [bacterium]
MYYLTRTYTFSAGHRLHSEALSEEENRRVFGKCNNPTGHGHNYTLEVTVRGQQDERTGTIGDVFKLDGIVEQHVLADYDHRFLNTDVPEFARLVPTSEHMVQAIWRRLAPHLERPQLYRVRLWETARSAFEYYGEEN